MAGKHIIWLLLSVLISVLIFAFWQQGAERESLVSPAFRELKADLALYGVRYRRDVRGKPSQWVVSASTARFYEKKKVVDFEDVEITFLPGKRDSILVSGDTGIYDFSSGCVSVTGNVVVTGFKGYILYTDTLSYDPASMTINAPGRARMVSSGGNRLIGKGLVYYIRTHRLLLASPDAIITGEDSDT